MQPLQNSRIDLADLKAQTVKKIGLERSKRYFYYLNRFLNQKLTKVEFDRLCFRILGRENLPLHNQFILSILKNASLAKTPPPVHEVGPTKSSVIEDGHDQSGPMLVVPNHNANAPIWVNGVVVPVSPRKGRSAIRDRRLKDRPSPLGLNGKPDDVSHQSTGSEDSFSKAGMENGNLVHCTYQRLVQSDDGRLKVKNLKDAAFSPHNKGPTEATIIEDGEDAKQGTYLNITRSPLMAPLGIPYCSASVGGARKALPSASIGHLVSYFDSGGLSDTETLKKHMDQIAIVQGLGGVSMECANVLNNMLDVYLKRLIRSCVELVGVKSGHELGRQPAQKNQSQSKPLNGLWPSNHLHMQNSVGAQETVQEHRTHCPISFGDFKVAMELYPQQLGEDWPSLLEKICTNAFNE